MSEELPPAKEVKSIDKPLRADTVKLIVGGEEIEIFPGNPLPEYNSGPANAYMARGKAGKVTSDYLALVCERHLVPRSMTCSSYKNFTNPMLMPLMASGPAFWGPAKEERFVLLYKNILGKRIHTPGTPEALAWRQENVMEAVVRPMAVLLREFKDANFVHGALRPSNMFANTATGKVQSVVLGDCLALPPSYMQPVLYEPVERAMAQPSGRGMGTIADDLYSWGVTLAVFLRSHDPLHEMSEEEIIKEKMEHGSYAAITGRDRFKGSILELLRGLLHDDPRERWTIEEVMTWLDGRRLSPKQSVKQKKAARPLAFDGKKYLYSSFLAMDLEKNTPEMVKLVEEGDLNQWLERSLEDEELTERVDAQIRSARERGIGPGYEDRLACQLSIALDPMAPIRYKGLHLSGEGIGAALAEAFITKRDLQPFVDLFMQGFAFTWLTSSKNPALDTGSLISRFDQCRNFIRHGKIAFGLERSVYFLCAECPCLSDKVRTYYIQSPEELINAFEDLCRKGSAPAMFLDRHSAAFLSVKEPKVIDSFLFDLGSPDDYRRILGNLKTLAAIQKRFNLQPFPGIAKVFMEAMPVIYKRYHDREVRQKLELSVKKFAAEGDLVKMEALVGNPDLSNKDYMAFRGAMTEYEILEREYKNLVLRLSDKTNFGRATGKELASIVSSGISALLIAAMVLMFLSQHSLL